MLTVDFSNFSAARTAIDLHATATGYSALGISNVLIAVSVTFYWSNKLKYLVLAECKRHAFVIASNLDIAVTKDLKGISDRILELFISFCGDKTSIVLGITAIMNGREPTWLRIRRR